MLGVTLYYIPYVLQSAHIITYLRELSLCKSLYIDVTHVGAQTNARISDTNMRKCAHSWDASCAAGVYNDRIQRRHEDTHGTMSPVAVDDGPSSSTNLGFAIPRKVKRRLCKVTMRNCDIGIFRYPKLVEDCFFSLIFYLLDRNVGTSFSISGQPNRLMKFKNYQLQSTDI